MIPTHAGAVAVRNGREVLGSRDPYPEDAYRAAVLARGEDIARQCNYFRTRDTAGSA